MDPIIFRAVERILIVLIGGFAVFLGYRLFLALPEHRDSGGKLTLPGDISVLFSRVGPGVFFALFGSGVVIASLHYAIKVESGGDTYVGSPSGVASVSPTPSPGGGRLIYAGAPAVESQADLNSRRTQLRRDLRRLASSLQSSENGTPALSPAERNSLDIALRNVGQASLLSVWSEDWGDYAVFLDWAKRGQEPAPEGIVEAVTFFRETQEVTKP